MHALQSAYPPGGGASTFFMKGADTTFPARLEQSPVWPQRHRECTEVTVLVKACMLVMSMCKPSRTGKERRAFSRHLLARPGRTCSGGCTGCSMHLSWGKAVTQGDCHVGEDELCQNTVVRVSAGHVKCKILKYILFSILSYHPNVSKVPLHQERGNG